MSKNESKHTITQGNIYIYISIFSRTVDYTSKLVRINNAILDNIKLELPSNYLLNKLIKYIITYILCLY